MDKDSINEMEQIQRGLERFLEQEVEGYQSGGKKQAEGAGGAGKDRTGRNEAYGPESDLHEDDYSGEEEYEDGLSGYSDDEEYEEEEQPEVKIDLLPGVRTGGKKNSAKAAAPDPVRDRAQENESSAGRGKVRHEPEPHKKREKTEKQKKSRKSRKSDISQEDTATASKGKKKKKKSKLKRFLIILLLIALVLAGLWYYMIDSFYGKMHYEEIDSVTEQPMKEKGVTNILLIGNDSRTQGEDGRSDAMILVSISNETRTIYMTSLLRDMYVEIPGHKGNRLNAAYSYGGAELLMETLEKNLDISVNRYVLVNFQAFANLVDAVGGVELELTNDEVIYINGYLVEYNILEGRPEGTDYLDASLSGLIHLNGPQALAYCRNRYLGTDFGRTERQRKVLSAVIKQAPMSLITNPKGMMDGLLPNLTTNLTQSECLELSLQGPKVITYDIVQNSIPIEGSYSNASIRGMSVLEVDFEKNKEFIRTNIYGREPDAGLFTEE